MGTFRHLTFNSHYISQSECNAGRSLSHCRCRWSCHGIQQLKSCRLTTQEDIHTVKGDFHNIFLSGSTLLSFSAKRALICHLCWCFGLFLTFGLWIWLNQCAPSLLFWKYPPPPCSQPLNVFFNYYYFHIRWLSRSMILPGRRKVYCLVLHAR